MLATCTYIDNYLVIYVSTIATAQEVMRLSLSRTTYPRSGTGGDYWGFARVVGQIPYPWRQFYVANPLHFV